MRRGVFQLIPHCFRVVVKDMNIGNPNPYPEPKPIIIIQPLVSVSAIVSYTGVCKP